MAGYTSDQIRNIALLGHAGSGKTSLTEALLCKNGNLKVPGTVASCNTISDFSDQEKQAGHSLETSLLHLHTPHSCINLLDSPGNPDLFGRALTAVAAVETVALVINGTNGIEPVTRYGWQQLKAQHKCGLIVINRIDECTDNPAKLEQLVSQIRDTFGDECLPINLPMVNGEVADCYFRPDFSVPTAILSVEAAHQQLVDQIVEVDDALMELYLEQSESITVEQLHQPFETALCDNHLVPICFTSTTTGAGIDLLLRVFNELMPTPLEGNAPLFIKGEGADAVEVNVVPDPERHVIAHTFKLSQDPFAGKLGVFRVHQGIVRSGSQLFVGSHKKPMRINQLFKLQGREQIPIQEAYPGEICAVPKADMLTFDAVLHDSHDEDYFHLAPLQFTTPVASLAITPHNQGDEQKLSDILHRIILEDPSLRIEHRERQNETVLLGLGNSHLQTALDKIAMVYRLEVDTHVPSIAYRETITQPAEGHHRHKKQNGGAGQFGEVFLRIEPLPRGEGFVFVDAVVGGAIPGPFIPAVEKGVREVLRQGAIAGYPIQDVKVTVYDGKHHPVDSKEIAFVQAGKKAFIAAMESARPVILEPFVSLRISTPQHCIGDITGDLSNSRGVVTGTDSGEGNTLVIEANAPLADIADYSRRLKALTAGEGQYTIDFSHYDPVPIGVQKELIAAWGHEESDV